MSEQNMKLAELKPKCNGTISNNNKDNSNNNDTLDVNLKSKNVDSESNVKNCSSGSGGSAGSAGSVNCAGGSSSVHIPQVYYDLSVPLAKLPVPPVKQTMDKYLTLMKTVLPTQDFARTKYLVDQLTSAQGQGQELQEYLLQKQQSNDNWANEWWLHDMYLNVKLPLIINSNAAFVFPYQQFPTWREQLRFASKFIIGMLDFKNLLDSRTLPIERCKYKEKGQPMCMEQHYRLFTSYREPGVDKDIQHTDLGTPGHEHIIVASKNQFHKLDVRHEGRILSEGELFQLLSHVVSLETNNQSAAVGVLTSLPRDQWAQKRKTLMKDSQNRENLSLIEHSLFIVCLDSTTVWSDRTESGNSVDMASRTHHILHGQGTDHNTGNRWFDKTVQFIVSEDGTCGLNMEHSVMEGIALGHMMEHAFNYMARNKPESECVISCLPNPKLLSWNLESQSYSDISAAKDHVNKLIDDTEIKVIKFENFGRDFIKSQKISPDAFIQLALQLTFYKIHRHLSSTYESCSVRRFRQGRVDVIRGNSPSALTWIKAMLGETENTEEQKRKLFKEAVKWQQDYTLDAICGQGIDLHLLGLKEAACALGLDLEIFKDKAFKELNNFRLSTSQVPANYDSWTGYGAVVPDGYGCCYNPQNDFLIFSIASFYSAPDTSSDMFAHSLESSLLQMQELCQISETIQQ